VRCSTYDQPSIAPVVVPAGDRPEQRRADDTIRQRIAERLLQSQANAASSHLHEVNMQPVIELRNKYKECVREEARRPSWASPGSRSKRGYWPCRNSPRHASVDGTDINHTGYFRHRRGHRQRPRLARAHPAHAINLSLPTSKSAIADFGVRAKVGKLTMEELSGGTFSILQRVACSFHVSPTPIIKPPQAAILGIHATKDAGGRERPKSSPPIIPRLSNDHRIIDGREASAVPRTIKEALSFRGACCWICDTIAERICEF